MTNEQTPSEKTPTTPDPSETPATPDASQTAEISTTQAASETSETPATPEAPETAAPAEASEPTEPAVSAEQAEEARTGVMHDPDHTPETAPAAEATQPIAPAAAAAAPPIGPPERPIFESEPQRPRRGRSGRTAAIAGVIAAAAVLGGGVGAALTSAVDSPETVTTTVSRDADATTAAAEPASRSGDLTVAELYRQTSPSVVEISVTSSGEEGGGGQGSGFVLDSEGHVVTNQHVVEGADSIRVTFSDGSSYDAELVGTDPSTDLAVIDVDAPADALEPVQLGDSDALEVGEEVVAMGSPYGLQETVTTGIVSALHRQITAPNGYAIGDAIQTDAAINPGNSGGPLLNLRGEVVGVNSQIETGGGGNDGVGFAVPANTVESIAAQLIEDGSVEHAYLGVTVETIPADVAGDIGEAAGVALVEVRDGTPAAEADLQGASGQETAGGRPYPSGGDVVTEIDGEAVTTAEELQARIDAKQPGDKLELTVVRDGKTRTVTVELGTRPD